MKIKANVNFEMKLDAAVEMKIGKKEMKKLIKEYGKDGAVERIQKQLQENVNAQVSRKVQSAIDKWLAQNKPVKLDKLNQLAEKK